MPNMFNNRTVLGVVTRRLLLVLVLCVAAAYPASRLGVFEWPRAYDPLALPDLTQQPNMLTPWQFKLVDASPENCVAAFNLSGQAVVLKPAKNVGAACEVSGAISVSRLGAAKIRTEDMRCALAARLAMWERNHLQPAAQRLLGESISEIVHFGSFSCRMMRSGGYMSQHATANAFDIAGFKTASGKLISVKRDWPRKSPEGEFLHAVRDGLCDWFNTTLSPDYNADHADHFHVDMGWWQSCR